MKTTENTYTLAAMFREKAEEQLALARRYERCPEDQQKAAGAVEARKAAAFYLKQAEAAEVDEAAKAEAEAAAEAEADADAESAEAEAEAKPAPKAVRSATGPQ